MSLFTISGVTCGGCEARVTRAVHAIDPDALLRFTADRRQLDVTSVADPVVLSAAITAQGYPAEPLVSDNGR